jgi:hypothetical protein
MRDILISSVVCVACLLLALVSQLVAPSTVVAASPNPATAAALSTAAVSSSTASAGRIELDPEDPNPTLFAMATDNAGSPDQIANSGANALGGELVAAKERVTPLSLIHI